MFDEGLILGKMRIYHDSKLDTCDFVQFLRSTLHALKCTYHNCCFNEWIRPHDPPFYHSSAPHGSVSPPSEETTALIFWGGYRLVLPIENFISMGLLRTHSCIWLFLPSLSTVRFICDISCLRSPFLHVAEQCLSVVHLILNDFNDKNSI